MNLSSMSTPVPALPRTLRLALFALGAILGLAPQVQAATLTVYAAMGYDARVARAFTHATGIRVNLVHLSTGPLLARVQAEAAHPQWDVLWFDGNLAMRQFARHRQLSCGWLPAVHYTPQGRALLPADRCYFPVGVTYAGMMLVNTRRLPQGDWPLQWRDLTKPALYGKVGMNNPAISGPTYPFVAGMMQHLGLKAGERYFERLKANGLKIFPRNSVTLRALQYGQIDVAVVQSSAALGLATKEPGLRVIPAAPSAELPSDLAIGARVQGRTLQSARRFVQFVLSPAGQKVLQEGDVSADSNYQPLLTGVRPVSALAKLTGVRPLVLNPAQWGPLEPKVVFWFTVHVAR
ncbi:MAG: extracellular solute-binding protein [Gammaproteobacteria bacterium]|nr:extracellular solute-binding protein [Gammaproteobacteria bacterium]